KDLLIIGGGLSGLALAASLKNTGISYSLFEKNKILPEADGGVLKLWPNALRALEKTGIVNRLLEKSSRIDTGIVLNHHGSELNRIPLHRIGEQSGLPTISLIRKRLTEELLKEIPRDAIFENSNIISIEEDASGVRIELSDQSRHQGKILAGTDGTHSFVKNHLFPERDLIYAGRISFRGLSDAAAILPEFSENASVEIFGSGMRFGFAPAGPKIGWYAPLNEDENFIPNNPVRYLCDKFTGWPPYVKELIESTDPDNIIQSPIRYNRPDTVRGKGDITLLGDAACTITPDLAQGACMALEDAAVFAGALEKYGPCDEALRIYESLRVPRVKNVAEKSMKIGKMSNKDGAFHAWLREKMWSWMPPGAAVKPIIKLVDDPFLPGIH
ncbi:MAG: FAD-dependent monooxygenase, partial [Spirochaetia bacterium]|nr:FAD-dependent monooxygenase [Spirochaetia bacterium]